MLPDQVSNPGPLTYESGALVVSRVGCLGVAGVCICSTMPHVKLPLPCSVINYQMISIDIQSRAPTGDG